MQQQVALPPRRTLVLEMLEAGRTAREIADELGISTQGVYDHMKHLRAAGVLPPSKEG